MADAAILNLLPVAIFNILPTLHSLSTTVQNFMQIGYLTPRLNYNNFLKSKMAAVRHFGIVPSSYRTTHKVF